MAQPIEQPRVLEPENRQDFSVAMHVGFGHEENGKAMKLAICIALYTVLALLWMPGFRFSDKVYVLDQTETQLERRKVLKPPPEKPVQHVETKATKAKKVPMPDRNPLNHAPTINAVAVDERVELLITDEWALDLPDGPPQTTRIAEVGAPGVDAPVIIKRVPPNYPQKGVAIRLQGYVILQAILRKDGSVDAIEVLRGLGRGKFGFEKAAIASLRKWTFIPGMLDGQPTDVRMNLRVDFILN